MNDESPKLQPGQPGVEGPAKLKCFAINEHPCELVPAPPERAWMDAYSNRHPYRCLPLSIANSHGWLVLMPIPIEVEWTGLTSMESLTVRALKPMPDGRPLEHFARSNFGHGIVTFHTDYIFQTPPGWDLLCTGPFNSPKDNCYPLTGIIETDWLPYPFTMNWRIMKPGKVVFEEGEAFCFIFPIPKQSLIDTQPEIHRLRDETELHRQHEQFRTSRQDFLDKMAAGDEGAKKQGWQRYYFTGKHPDGTRVEGHMNKLRLKDPVDLRRPADQAPSMAADLGGLKLKPAAAAKPDFSLLLQGAATGTAKPAPRAQPIAVASPSSVAGERRWLEGSALDYIDNKQSILNVAGRSRLKDGILVPSPHTRRIASPEEAAEYGLVCVENMLSAQECTYLSDVFHRHKDMLYSAKDNDPFWNNRFVWLHDILKVEPEAAELMAAASHDAREAVASFYKLTAPIYSDILQIVQWPVGMSMPPHADQANPNGSPHGMAYRDFGGITYLNDDYEGGELYLTALDVVIKPKRGMFLGFTAGFHHEHAVLKVTSGNTRLTMPTFYTFDRSHANPLLHPDAAEAVRARLQG
ncbi:MAG: 2OG-Fe(II) oxygenase [Alphaproteobacteria bacterium]|nr:2OG-Fe(II) oxygenase [Alphaproteobacteria bacterium]